jgi:hypothetical protein
VSGGGEEKIGARVAAGEVFSYRTGRRPIGHPIDQVKYVAPLRFLPYRRKTREVQHGSRWAIDQNLVGGKGFSWACFSFSAISSLLLFFFQAATGCQGKIKEGEREKVYEDSKTCFKHFKN